MGAGVSGNQGKPSILAGAGRGRAFDAANDAAALRLLEDQKHLFADWPAVLQSLQNGTIIVFVDMVNIRSIRSTIHLMTISLYN